MTDRHTHPTSPPPSEPSEVEAHVERMMQDPEFREALNDDSPVEGRPAEEVLAPYLGINTEGEEPAQELPPDTLSDLRIVREELSFVSDKGFIDCNGDKCRQSNCVACYGDPVKADPKAGRAALERIGARLALEERLRAEIVDDSERIESLVARLAAAEAENERLRAMLEASQETTDELRTWFRDLEVNVSAKARAAQVLGPGPIPTRINTEGEGR